MIYKKYERAYKFCLLFMFLSIGVGFVVSQCLVWPKEFRGGVFNKLDDIAVLQQENTDKSENIEFTIKLLHQKHRILVEEMYLKGFLSDEIYKEIK